jgi:hypothetical protein
MNAAATTSMYDLGAELEHGWAPSTPVGDSLARRTVLAIAESTARPSEVMGACSARTADVVATHLGRPAGYWNAAVVMRPLDNGGWRRLQDTVDALLALVGATGSVDLWSPFPTPDLGGDGWELAGHPVAMWRPPGRRRAPVPADLRIERVTDRNGVAEWAEAAVGSFPLRADPQVIATAALLRTSDISLFIGRVGGEAVAVSASVATHGTNAVPLVATSAHARRRGYGEAITWAATSVRPDLPAVLLSSDDGRPVYERMGYLALSRWTSWTRPTPTTATTG